MPRLDQMMGDLFYHRVAPSEIKMMSYREMKYWHGWIKVIEETKAKALSD
jgi:hypothetical protein